MKISIILAHPNQGSFNHAIARAALDELRNNGHQVCLHDLYEERFDPVLPVEEIPESGIVAAVVEEHCRELREADGIIIVHPNWWGQPPAILKGWIDRVLRPGVAYNFAEGDQGEGVPIGLLKAKAAIVFNTSNTPIERELKSFGDPLELLWKKCIFELCGIKKVHRETFGVVVTSTGRQREEWLKGVRKSVRQQFGLIRSTI